MFLHSIDRLVNQTIYRMRLNWVKDLLRICFGMNIGNGNRSIITLHTIIISKFLCQKANPIPDVVIAISRSYAVFPNPLISLLKAMGQHNAMG